MKEIKFRVKGVDGKWWIGELNPTSGNVNLAWFFPNLYGDALIPESLAQYTGLKDSQAIEEYYGDVAIATFDGGDEWELFVIEDGTAAVLYRNIDTDEIWYFWMMPIHYVIGNIYENPELLK